MAKLKKYTRWDMTFGDIDFYGFEFSDLKKMDEEVWNDLYAFQCKLFEVTGEGGFVVLRDESDLKDHGQAGTS